MLLTLFLFWLSIALLILIALFCGELGFSWDQIFAYALFWPVFFVIRVGKSAIVLIWKAVSE